MAREMYLAGVSEEEMRPEPKPEGPKTFKGKWDNFWYHYKWPVIIGTSVIVVVAVMFFQLFTRDEPDYLIVLATQNIVSDSVSNQLAADFQKYGRDVNGDGKIEVQVEAINLDNQTQTGMINKQKLLAHFSAGDAMFFIFDQKTYDENVAVFQDKTDDYQFFSKIGIQADGLANDGLYWDWKNDPIRNDPQLSALPADLYFGIRDVSGTASSKSSIKLHDECMDLLEAYLTKTPLTNSNQ